MTLNITHNSVKRPSPTAQEIARSKNTGKTYDNKLLKNETIAIVGTENKIIKSKFFLTSILIFSFLRSMIIFKKAVTSVESPIPMISALMPMKRGKISTERKRKTPPTR